MLGDNIYSDGRRGGEPQNLRNSFADSWLRVSSLRGPWSTIFAAGPSCKSTMRPGTDRPTIRYGFSRETGLIRFFALDSNGAYPTRPGPSCSSKKRASTPSARTAARKTTHRRRRNGAGSRSSTRSLARMSCSSMNRPASRCATGVAPGCARDSRGAMEGRLFTRSTRRQQEPAATAANARCWIATSARTLFVAGGVDLVLPVTSHDAILQIAKRT